jgi:hypothetical protein
VNVESSLSDSQQRPNPQRETQEVAEPKSHRESVIGWCATGTLGFVFVAAGGALGLWGYSLIHSSNPSLGLPIALTAVLLIVTGVAIPSVSGRERRIQQDELRQCLKDCDELENALSWITNKALSGLAISNFKQMRRFTLEAVHQARRAAYACVAASWTSLMILAAGAAWVVAARDDNEQIIAAILTGLSACLSTFMTRTFFHAYHMTVRQMGYYYGQPLVHCYLLHAEWLVNEFTSGLDPKQKSQLLQKVIEASLNAGYQAQSHLVKLQADGRATSKKAPRQPLGFDKPHDRPASREAMGDGGRPRNKSPD